MLKYIYTLKHIMDWSTYSVMRHKIKVSGLEEIPNITEMYFAYFYLAQSICSFGAETSEWESFVVLFVNCLKRCYQNPPHIYIVTTKRLLKRPWLRNSSPSPSSSHPSSFNYLRSRCNISNMRGSVSSGYPNTEKRVENTTRSGVFLTKFEVFGKVVKQCLECFWYIFSIETKTKEKKEK